MVLIDTSCWTHALRRVGDPAIRARVNHLLVSNQAAWCDVVRLELWNGAASDTDKAILKNLEATVPLIPITAQVWDHAIQLSQKARVAGLTAPVTDLLIFSCAAIHDLQIEHADKHYDLLLRLK